MIKFCMRIFSLIALSASVLFFIINTTFAGSESYSTIGVGYYDRDYVPDFIVKYLHGPGYPVYKYEQTVVLSGKGILIIFVIFKIVLYNLKCILLYVSYFLWCNFL